MAEKSTQKSLGNDHLKSENNHPNYVEFTELMKNYKKDKRVAKIFSDPIVARELFGSYNDSKNMSNDVFHRDWRRVKKYGANHIYQMMRVLRKDAKILELAGANGWASALLVENGFKEVMTTDINPFDYNGLQGIRRMTKERVATRIMSFEKIDLPRASKDVVFMVSSLHHSSNVYNVARQVHSVLSKNGQWFILGEPIRGLLDPQNASMKASNESGFNDNFYYYWHYRREITRAGFRINVLFPQEFDNILSARVKDNCKTGYKIPLLKLAKWLYKFTPTRLLIQKIYPLSLYFIGTHSVIMCERI